MVVGILFLFACISFSKILLEKDFIPQNERDRMKAKQNGDAKSERSNKRENEEKKTCKKIAPSAGELKEER